MKLPFIVFAALVTTGSFGQTTSTPKKEHQRVKSGFGVTVVQSQPEFPGGQDSLDSFLRNNLVYPQQAKLNGIHGRVYIGYLIDKTGKIKNVRVLSGVNDELNNEALRVVQLFPDWKPGSKGGTAVDVQYILPLDFYIPPKRDK